MMIDLLEILDGQLDDGREARTAEADKAALTDGVEEILHGVELRRVKLLQKRLFAVGFDDDGLHQTSAGGDCLIDLFDGSGYAGVDGRGDEAAGLADELPDLDLVPGLDDRNGGRADVHGHRDLHRFRDGQAQRGQLRGIFAVRHMHAMHFRSHPFVSSSYSFLPGRIRPCAGG